MLHLRPLIAAFSDSACLLHRSRPLASAAKPPRRLWARRRLASGAFMLASFLEICGCNPVRTCEQVRATELSAVPWEVLEQQCARCLSTRELTALRGAHNGMSTVASPAGDTGESTVQDALAETSGTLLGAEEQVSQTTLAGDGGSSMWEDSASSVLRTDKPIAWPVSEAVLFLYAAEPGLLHGAPQRIATGFILRVPDGGTRPARFLVTARHVVDPEWAHCGGRNPANLIVRFNRWDGGVAYETLPLASKRSGQIITAEDDRTDLALIPLDGAVVRNLNQYRLSETTVEALPTAEELNLLQRERQIVTVGVSSPHLTGLRDAPVSSPGMIASDPSGATVGVRCTADSPTKSIRMWRANTAAVQSVSGAPVYAAIERGHNRVATPVLVGVQAVVWPERAQAGVTPISALLDLIQIERVRTEIAMNMRKEHPE